MRSQGGVPVAWTSSLENCSGIQFFLSEFAVGWVFDLLKVRKKPSIFDLPKVTKVTANHDLLKLSKTTNLRSRFLESSHLRSSHVRSHHLRSYTNNFSLYDIKMLSQLLEELELKAKNRGIKGYESMPINKSLSIVDESEPIK